MRACAQQTLWLAPVELIQPYLDNLVAGKDKNNDTLIKDWINDDRNKADNGDLWRHLWRGHDHDTLAARIAAALAIHATLLQPLMTYSDASG